MTTAYASQLTPREIQTVRLIAQKLSVSEMATAMGISRGSVRGYIRDIAQKWGTAERADMVRIGRQLGVITDSCPTCGRA
jgi:DNA-binding CsgD family transcriptional regulator